MNAPSRIRLPADIDLEDRLAWGLTARQLAILAATALLCYGVFTAVGAALPLPVAVAASAPFGLCGVGLALGRLDGLSGDRLALAAARHLSKPTRRVAVPEGQLPAVLAGAPAQRSVCLLDVPVRTVRRSGVVELADGSSCLLAHAAGASWQLRGEEERHALTEAYGRWLNSLTEPTAITVRSEPVDLSGRASAIERSARELAHPALGECASAYSRFLRGLSEQTLCRREILLVLSTRVRNRHAASTTLGRRAGEANELLRQAGVELHPLDGEQAAGLLFGALEPPGAPAGCQLDGTIRRR